MHSVVFYPLGNADSCRIDLECGKKLLFDYAQCRDDSDENDLRCDLAAELRQDLRKSGRDFFDVVAFTHADQDHIQGASEFFHLEHAAKYQGGDRVRVAELWVPAAMVVEENPATEDARVLRAEARYRLKQKSGIRVFSRPDRLLAWLEAEGIALDEVRHLITDAGQVVPGFTAADHGVSFFAHSPFAARVGEGLVDRNECSLILQAMFSCQGTETPFLIIGDTNYDVLSEIVSITKSHGRDNRLSWTIFDIPHHCSYLALNSKENRGEQITEPSPDVKWLLGQGSSNGILVSCSKPIPADDSDDNPPHRQAANCYKGTASAISGEFRVTMEFPSAKKPRPLTVTIDGLGATVKKPFDTGPEAIISQPARRAG